MNKQEADKLVAKCKMLWGNPFKITSSTALDWAQAAHMVSYENMNKALDSFAEAGDKFPPSLAELISRARSFNSGPSWLNPDRMPNVCNWCGGPFWSGAAGERTLKAHMPICPTMSNDLVLDVPDDLPQYSDKNSPIVPMPAHVKADLRKLIKNG